FSIIVYQNSTGTSLNDPVSVKVTVFVPRDKLQQKCIITVICGDCSRSNKSQCTVDVANVEHWKRIQLSAYHKTSISQIEDGQRNQIRVQWDNIELKGKVAMSTAISNFVNATDTVDISATVSHSSESNAECDSITMVLHNGPWISEVDLISNGSQVLCNDTNDIRRFAQHISFARHRNHSYNCVFAWPIRARGLLVVPLIPIIKQEIDTQDIQLYGAVGKRDAYQYVTSGRKPCPWIMPVKIIERFPGKMSNRIKEVNTEKSQTFILVTGVLFSILHYANIALLSLSNRRLIAWNEELF
ncbi:hypothetical protein FGIG_08586, partial [Fasciola gigantica]